MPQYKGLAVAAPVIYPVATHQQLEQGIAVGDPSHDAFVVLLGFAHIDDAEDERRRARNQRNIGDVLDFPNVTRLNGIALRSKSKLDDL